MEEKTNVFENPSISTNVVADAKTNDLIQKIVEELQKQTNILNQINDKNKDIVNNETIQKEITPEIPVQTEETNVEIQPETVEPAIPEIEVAAVPEQVSTEVETPVNETPVEIEMPAIEVPTQEPIVENNIEQPKLNPVSEQTVELPQIETPEVNDINNGIIGIDELLSTVSPAEVTAPEVNIEQPVATPVVPEVEAIKPDVEIVPASESVQVSGPIPAPVEIEVPTVVTPEVPEVQAAPVVNNIEQPVVTPVEGVVQPEVAPSMESNIEVLDSAILDGASAIANSSQRSLIVDNNNFSNVVNNQKTLINKVA